MDFIYKAVYSLNLVLGQAHEPHWVIRWPFFVFNRSTPHMEILIADTKLYNFIDIQLYRMVLYLF